MTFWLTAFIWDYFTYFVTIIIFALVFAAFQEPGWSSPTEISRILVVLGLFGFAVLPVTYVSSKFFTVPASGFTRMTMFYVFTGRYGFFIFFPHLNIGIRYILYINIFCLGLGLFFTIYLLSLPEYDLADIADSLIWIFLIFPHFALSHSLSSIHSILQIEERCKLECELNVHCTDLMRCSNAGCCGNKYSNNHFYFITNTHTFFPR